MRSTRYGVHYWLRDKAHKNFGDYLSEWFLEHIFDQPKGTFERTFLVGSIIADWAIESMQSRPPSAEEPTLAFWGCGLREPVRPSSENLKTCRFFGVRGPITRSILGLPESEPIGDPGLVLRAFYAPALATQTAGKTVCMPHFNEPKPYEKIQEETGCDVILSPKIDSTLDALEHLLDQIASASLVLAGSLHSAIVACAYGVPFAFYNSGHIDCPFKWVDFAASVGIEATFVGSVAQYIAEIAPLCRRPKVPPIVPLLLKAPFTLRPGCLEKAQAADASIDGYVPRLIGNIEAEGHRVTIATVDLCRIRMELIQGRNRLAEKERRLAELDALLERHAEELGQAKSKLVLLERAIEGEIQRANSVIEELRQVRTTLAEKEQRVVELDALRGAEAQRARGAIEDLRQVRTALGEKEGRVAELEALLDRRTSNLARAHGKLDHLESAVEGETQRANGATAELRAVHTLLLEKERQISGLNALLEQHTDALSKAETAIAQMKRTLAWHLTSPLRSLSRPFGNPGADRFRVPLIAAFRHPISSAKRKRFRAERSEKLVRAHRALAHRQSQFGIRLRAIVRHPFSSPLRKSYRQRRNSMPGSLRGTSRFRVRLLAALKHPANAAKRRQLRSRRMAALVSAQPDPRKHSHFATNLRAVARYPFSSSSRKTYRAYLRSTLFSNGPIAPATSLPASTSGSGTPRGRPLRADFDGAWYQEHYPDAALSGLDAHEHYLRVGYLDGRPCSPGMKAGRPIEASMIKLHRDDNPEVTIIVPAYKNFSDTLRCLYSIASDTISTTKYKVIIADDCPSDPTSIFLADAEGPTIVTNPVNLGFLRNCNVNARSAEGDYIVFLNNDTVVTPGWLDALVDTARSDPSVGMVGCKLLNADGTVQEAGGVIYQNGWGYSYGRGDDPARPEYNYVRQVDVVTGACFLVRREAFERLGGFDEVFAPAFYEEFDLAFAMAEHGYKVVYQPASEVYHLGSASYGAEQRDRQSTLNHKKFCQKWARRLGERFEDSRALFLARDRKVYKATLLVVDDFIPQYDKHAGSLTIFQYVQMLVGEGIKVIFVPDHRIPIQPYTHVMQQMGVEVLHDNFDFDAWLDAAGPFLDWAWVARPDVAPKYLSALREKTGARLVYYTHDLHFLREMRRYEISGEAWALEESQRLRPIECDIFRKVDCVTTPSEEEARIIADLAPGQTVRVLPPYFFKPDESQCQTGRDLEERKEIIFVGGFDHVPNVDAARILVRDIMPLVWDSVPDARVLIVGNKPPEPVRELAEHRVDVTGFVPSLDPYYARARLSLSPLRYGAGVKGKIVSSLQAGVPVVTTGIGNEGIGLIPGLEALIGETPAELAAHVVTLYQDRALLRLLAAQGRRVVRDRFSVERAREAFFSAFDIDSSKLVNGRSR